MLVLVAPRTDIPILLLFLLLLLLLFSIRDLILFLLLLVYHFLINRISKGLKKTNTFYCLISSLVEARTGHCMLHGHW